MKRQKKKEQAKNESRGHLGQRHEFELLARFLELQGEGDSAQRRMSSLVAWMKAQPWYDPKRHRANPQGIWAYVRRALPKGYLRFCPPRSDSLRQRFEARFGLFLWLKLPEGKSANDLIQTALENKVAYVPGMYFFSEVPDDTTMRINFCNATEENIKEGVRRLAKVFREA